MSGPYQAETPVEVLRRDLDEAAEIIRLCEEALEDYVNDCTNEECEFCIKARTALAQIKGQNP